jgi:hypothetical protein
MKRSSTFARIACTILAITFITGQVFAGQISSNPSNNTLAGSVVSDPDINPARSGPVRNDIAGKAEPGAIGNGAPLMELAQGKLPPRLTIPFPDELEEVNRKVHEAIRLALKLTLSNGEKLSLQNQQRAKQTVLNMILLQNKLSQGLYLFTADIRGPEDYLLGFNLLSQDKFAVGLSFELIDRLYSISPLRLAQYIFHECVPERGIITERDDHRAVYNEIQSAIFGQDEVFALKKDLRGFIDQILQVKQGTRKIEESGKSVIDAFREGDARIAALKIRLRSALSHKITTLLDLGRSENDIDKTLINLFYELTRDPTVEETISGKPVSDAIKRESESIPSDISEIEAALYLALSHKFSQLIDADIDENDMSEIEINIFYELSRRPSLAAKVVPVSVPAGFANTEHRESAKGIVKIVPILPSDQKAQDEKKSIRHVPERSALELFVDTWPDGSGVAKVVPAHKTAHLDSAIEALRHGSETLHIELPQELRVTLASQIFEDLPVRAQVFKANLTRILAEYPDQLFFMGIETDIGESQKAQIMPIYKAIDEIRDMQDANGKPLFPNLMVRRAKAGELASMVSDLNTKGKLNLNNAFIGARKVSVDNKAYDAIKGDGRAWISAIDDSKPGDYLPVFEAITLNMMAYLNADLTAIKNFYDAISDKPIDPKALQDMLKNRIIYILPKITAFDTKQLRDLYELAHQVYIAA